MGLHTSLHASLRGCALTVVAILAVASSGCAAGNGILQHDIELEDGHGKRVWKLEPDATQVELEDAAGNTIVELTRTGDRIVAKSPARRIEVRRAAAGATLLSVHDQQSGENLVSLVREPDRDLRVEDSQQGELYELKVRDYGFKIVRRDGSEWKVRQKSDGISVRSASDQTVFSTDTALAPLAIACLGLEGLPIEIRVALAAGVLAWYPHG